MKVLKCQCVSMYQDVYIYMCVCVDDVVGSVCKEL